jgi:hypothetical protein
MAVGNTSAAVTVTLTNRQSTTLSVVTGNRPGRDEVDYSSRPG